MTSSSSTARWNALVVDDEPLAREGMRMLLAAEDEIQKVLEARSGAEAVELIRSEEPDIVFLDVQMPEMNGFEVLQEIGPESMPAVIFVTAHDQYAIKAFEINAIDYLLKPVTRQRFKEALRRATDRLRSPSTDERMLSMLQTIASPRKYMTRIAVRSGGKTYFVELAEVDWMQAAENYVQLHTASAKHLVHVPIQTLQDSIDPDRFLRIHRSLIVNLQQVKEIEPASHGECVLVLHSGVRLQSSRTYSDAIRRWANNPF
jgi:two-component system, LytTR family, response regulator